MTEVHALQVSDLLREVRRVEIQSNRLVTGVMAGSYASVFRGSGIEVDEVREYVEGDDPRRVDWNVTARMGRPFVKEYVDEREATVLFLLDLSASMNGGFGAFSARQMAARVCACLALAAVKNNDNVGLVAFSQGVDHYVPAKKGVRHALRVLRDCLAAQASSARTEMGPALEFVSRVVRHRAIVFVLSDFLAGGWRRELSLCNKHHDVIAARLLLPELDPANSGLVRVRDPETGRLQVVDFSNASTQRSYAARVADWHLRTKQALQRAGVDLMDVRVPLDDDPEAVARPILDFFRMREMRGRRR